MHCSGANSVYGDRTPARKVSRSLDTKKANKKGSCIMVACVYFFANLKLLHWTEVGYEYGKTFSFVSCCTITFSLRSLLLLFLFFESWFPFLLTAFLLSRFEMLAQAHPLELYHSHACSALWHILALLISSTLWRLVVKSFIHCSSASKFVV